MFAGPEHESYLTLMRGLRLERAYWQPGDLRWDPRANPAAWPGQIIVISDTESAEAASMASDRAAVWLPRLDQWLSMLEEAAPSDEWMLYQEGLMADGSGRKRYCAEFEHGPTMAAPTPEEACARLWMAVTGRTSDA